ncbi:MAG TPA: hypothetical protein VG941_02115 [Candidatus Paceibacterota bacterium]|nr:hypothetical protein [Candidatus Paceibacterota bacterium]
MTIFNQTLLTVAVMRSFESGPSRDFYILKDAIRTLMEKSGRRFAPAELTTIETQIRQQVAELLKSGLLIQHRRDARFTVVHALPDKCGMPTQPPTLPYETAVRRPPLCQCCGAEMYVLQKRDRTHPYRVVCKVCRQGFLMDGKI